MSTRYEPTKTGVRMIGNHPPAELPLEQVCRLLDVFWSVGAKRPFNDLYEAAKQVPGFLPSVGEVRVGRAA